MAHAPTVDNGTAAGDAIAPWPGCPLDMRVVVFTVDAGTLKIAFLEQDGVWRLPRGAPRAPELLDREAGRIVRDETGLQEQYLEQLYTLGAEDDAAWSVIVSYIGLSHAAGGALPIAGGRWWEARSLPPLGPVDRKVVTYALVRLRAKLGYTTIAFHLLPPTFTLRELQQVYESVLGRELDKRNFRRRVLAAGFLAETGEQRRDGSHRPAQVYRFRAVHDPDTYLTPAWAQGA